MPLEFDIVDDMEIFDFLQSGIYRSWGTGDTFTDYPFILCLRRSISHKLTPVSNANVQQDKATWHVKFTDIQAAGITVKLRDRILDENGEEWWVESFTTETLNTRYKLECSRVKNTA